MLLLTSETEQIFRLSILYLIAAQQKLLPEPGIANGITKVILILGPEVCKDLIVFTGATFTEASEVVVV